jgi:hypothetical protein
MKRSWLVMQYHLNREPSAPRVSTWRKLKKLGAVLVQDALWILPENNRNREQLRWLAAEILEFGGTANLWASNSLLNDMDTILERAFLEQVEPGYGQLLEALQEDQPNLAALSKQFQTLQAQDHLQSELGQRVRKALEQNKEQP